VLATDAGIAVAEQRSPIRNFVVVKCQGVTSSPNQSDSNISCTRGTWCCTFRLIRRLPVRYVLPTGLWARPRRSWERRGWQFLHGCSGDEQAQATFPYEVDDYVELTGPAELANRTSGVCSPGAGMAGVSVSQVMAQPGAAGAGGTPAESGPDDIRRWPQA
jgi:hypothetical protein